MVRWISFAAGCVLTALVAVSAAGATSASAPVVSTTSAAQSTYSRGGDTDGYDTAAQWTTTKEARAWAEALFKLDYSAMTLADFRAEAAPWQDETYHKAEDAHKRLRFSLEEDDPLRAFVRGPLEATMGEAASLHYKGTCDQWKPSYDDTAKFEVKADVFGDSYTVFSAQANYEIVYTAADDLTVGEREQLFADYQKAVEIFLSKKGEKALKDVKTLGKALETELNRLNKQLSTAKMTLQAKLDGYEAYDWRY